MSDKVVSLVPEKKLEPNTDVIETLEKALKDAKSGELQGLLMVGHFHDGNPATAMNGTLTATSWGMVEEMRFDWYMRSIKVDGDDDGR